MKIIELDEKSYISSNYREWIFHQDNVTDMIKKVEILEDRDIVKLDLWDMDWKKYMITYMTGIEKFILKEDSKSRRSPKTIIIVRQKYVCIEKSMVITWITLILVIFGCSVKFNILNKFC